MIIGTAGHIDHGKTALIKALTGVDADRLKEEKARGITIDLGYAYAPLPDGSVLGFIDVPGHERFVHNMLAGATGIDLALLVVAADDGVMPQTREHLEILDLLGIARGAVALTKIDRVDPERVAQVEADIERLLADTRLAGSPVFPVSSVTGQGIAALRAHLEKSAAATRAGANDGHFRLAVDRCFTLEGHGTVVTGTVFAGRVRVGDRLWVSPRGTEVRVRGIHAQNRESQEGQVGQRCALNLAGIDKHDIARGDWLLESAAHAPTDRLDVWLRVPASASRPLWHWTPVHLHLGAADVMAHVALLEATSLAPGASGFAQLVLAQPIDALHGDRLILRDQSGQTTVAGGSVLDPFAPACKTRTPQRLATLAALRTEAAAPALAALLDSTAGGVDLAWFARTYNLRPAVAEALCADAPMTVLNVDGQRVGFAPARWQEIEQATVTTLAAEHRRAPELLGLDARQLRRLAAPELAWEVFSALVAQLLDEKRIARHGPWLHLPSHRITLTPAEEKLWRAVAPLLRATPLQPPWVRDIAAVLKTTEVQVRMLLKRVTLIGDTYEVLHDRFFTREAVTQLAQIAAELDAANGEVRAAEFRDRIGSGRKLAIQILEYFDRTGYSRRIGDAHRMRDPALLVDRIKSAGATPITGRDSHPGGAT